MTHPDGDSFLILETTHWRAILRSNQTYLGHSVVTLKRRDCGNLSDLTTEEIVDFLALSKKLENSLRKTFNTTMFNWTCLMNASYKNTPPNPHVHWHFWPRYNHEVEFAGQKFIDPNFGSHYIATSERNVDPELKKKIITEIKKYINN